MESWVDVVNFSFAVTGIILTILGLILVYVIRYLNKPTKLFFTSFFGIILLYVSSDLLSQISLVLLDGRYVLLSRVGVFLESFLSSLLIIMLLFYLLRSTNVDISHSKSYKAVLINEFFYLLLLCLTQFIPFIFYFDEKGVYHRGPWYPVLLIPTVLSMTTVLLKLVHKKSELSRRQFIAFLLYIIIPIVSMLIQMFFYGILFIVIGTVISSIILFASIVISQINAYIDEKALNEVYLTDILLLQMRPHFIYNTMSSIYYLCDLDPKKAQTVVRDFSIYLKKNFSALSKRELIPFDDELEHTRAYLAIEKARYEKLLFVEYDIQNTDFHLPPLILQPMVENAVKHGVDPDFPSLHIWVHTYRKDNKNIIIVENTGPDFTPAAENDTEVHVGSENVKKRLELMCNGTLETAPRDGGGTVVTITIP